MERRMTDAYRPLYEFLNSRFADRVVLTFAQIEDLLGFPMPPTARTEIGWWTRTDTPDAEHQHAWQLAKRSAVPNLRAMTVAFERV
jgi:hypothetical protein